MRISDWSSDVCSSDLTGVRVDALIARVIAVVALLAIEASVLVGLEQAVALRRRAGRKTGIGRGGGGAADRGDGAHPTLGEITHEQGHPWFEAPLPRRTPAPTGGHEPRMMGDEGPLGTTPKRE